jgi:tripeptide aminopeptidase
MPETMTTNKTSVLERFLRYVKYDTQSAEGSATYPSTLKQLVLLDQLVKELKELGLADAARDENGVVFATIPSTSKKKNVPVIGFLAHVDTSPESPGVNVKPVVHANWNGEDISYADDPALKLRPSEVAALRERKGHDIVTASGLTLLGADDKAGVAEIMAAAQYLLEHPQIAHGPIRIGFTPDEEVGHGAEKFDVKAFGAMCAYTMDGEERGVLDLETFSGDSMTVTFQGFNTHPGFAKGRMVNAIRVAGEFLARLPKDRLSPETTEGREGYLHPYMMDASVDRTSVKFIIRDFRAAGLAESEALIEKIARETVAAYAGASVSFKVEESYRNFKEVLDRHPEVVANAREGFKRSGLEVVEGAIRGGTDGSRLSYMGLPTPNIFAGGHNFHSRLEWVSVQDMEKATEVIVNIARVWEERA